MFAAFELMTLLLFGPGATMPEAIEAEKIGQLNIPPHPLYLYDFDYVFEWALPQYIIANSIPA
jgi:hypothetical protein